MRRGVPQMKSCQVIPTGLGRRSTASHVTVGKRFNSEEDEEMKKSDSFTVKKINKEAAARFVSRSRGGSIGLADFFSEYDKIVDPNTVGTRSVTGW